MSQTALMLAVVNRLKKYYGWGDDVIDIVPRPGRPPATAGELFISVWDGGFSNDSFECRHDDHSFNITVTRRMPVTPYDRSAPELIHKAKIGLEAYANALASYIHTNRNGYDILQLANKYIEEASPPTETVYGFGEPPRFLHSSGAEERGGDWFHADGAADMCGLSITLSFGKAIRVQSIALQT